MSIRNKLILLFVSIVALILTGTSVAVYFFSAYNREEEFYKRLENKARITAKLLIEVDEVTPEVLKRIEKDNPTSLPNEEIKIYDGRNNVLYTSDKEEFLRILPSTLNQVRARHVVRFRQDEYECLAFLYADRFGEFVVVAGAIDQYGNQKLANLRTILLVVAGIAILIILVSGYFYVSKALQPIAKVIHEVDDISATSLHRRLEEGDSHDEFSKLARTFNQMLARLEQAFATQKTFISNASHELRNPMTAILGQIDVSLLNTRSAEEYQSVLRSIREDISNLITVSNRLLLLAQASAEDVEKRFTLVRLDQLLWDAKEELVKTHPDYQIEIDMEPSVDDEGKLEVQGDEQLLKGAIINILDNGCKYSPDHRVWVRIGSSGKRTVLNFRDMGIGISPEDLPYLFEPFYRGKNAQTFKGNGIGLSLAYRVIKSHLGDIDVETTVNKGTRIMVSLPRSVVGI